MDLQLEQHCKLKMQSLSNTIRQLHDEATQLLNLRAAWGRLPNSNRKSSVLAVVEEWFNEAEDYSLVAIPTIVPWALIQELWENHPSVRNLLNNYLSAGQLDHLKQGMPVQDSNPYCAILLEK